MADLNELVLAYEENVAKEKRSFYDKIFRPRIKEALLEPTESIKNFGKNFVVVFRAEIPKGHVVILSGMVLECAQMLVDEGFMFFLDPENVKIKPSLDEPQSYSHDYFGKTDRTKLKPGFAHTPRVEKMFDIRLTFTRAEPLNTVKGTR